LVFVDPPVQAVRISVEDTGWIRQEAAGAGLTLEFYFREGPHAMVNKIEQDHGRFKQIVRGKIRHDLRRFIAKSDMIGKEGQRYVSIPVTDIDIPTFRYGDNSGGLGMGEGEEGEGAGRGKGGEQQGRHLLEVDISLEELADMLGEDLQLPRIEPKGQHAISTTKDKYNGVRPIGPAALRHFKRTYREALRRQLTIGTYDPENPVIVPIKRDLRFRSWNEVRKPQSNALIVYMMDVSGSMGNEQKQLVRQQAFWIDAWLGRNYQGVESRYIVHDVEAREVDRSAFFSMKEDGGTRISAALAAAGELIEAEYDPAVWNMYLFHFSDGDNSSDADNKLCVQMLRQNLLPKINMFGYTQVKSAYGSGQFYPVLKEEFGDGRGLAEQKPGDALAAKVSLAKVNDQSDIYESLRTLFAAGR